MNKKAIDLERILSNTPLDMGQYTGLQNTYTAATMPFRNWVRPVEGILPAWWTPARDIQLRTYWQKSDHVAGTLFTIQALMSAMRWKITARDEAILSHVRQAEEFERRLRVDSQFGEGWSILKQRTMIDLHTQDNGFFWLILGGGPADGPLIGPSYSIAHLDSGRCTRTGNLEYPVLYLHTDGKQYKLHHTRVAFTSSMPSPILEMNGVGYCAVSRVIATAQHLMDITRWEQERLGSRPPSSLLIGSGITAEQIYRAFEAAENQMTRKGYERFSRMIAMGSLSQLDLKRIDLSQAPDGYDKKEDWDIAMMSIALGFGLEIKAIWASLGTGTTNASAKFEHMLATGKGPSQIRNTIEHLMNSKVLPPYLEFKYDWVDDEEDNAKAVNSDLRARAARLNRNTGVISLRTARLQALAASDITREQFLDDELADGRLGDGSDVLLLFNSSDAATQAMLDIGVDHPLRVYEHLNERLAILAAIQQKIEEANAAIHDATTSNNKRRAREALSALTKLRGMYLGQLDMWTGEPVPVGAGEAEGKTPKSEPSKEPPRTDKKPDTGNAQNSPDAPRVERPIRKSRDFDTYRGSIADLVYGLWEGRLQPIEFMARFNGVVDEGITAAWNEGAAEAGIQPQDFTPVEILQMQSAIATEKSYVANIVTRIQRYRDEGKPLSILDTTIDDWANGYNKAKNLALMYADNDPMLEWAADVSKEHCEDCGQLKGHIHRASEWQEANIYPQSNLLSCKGYRCGCKFIKTTKLATDKPIPIFL